MRAMKVYGPQLNGPWLAEGWATPLASSVTVPDATEVPVQVLEVVKNVNVTVPVGVPKAPARVALACNITPVRPAHTTFSFAFLILKKYVAVSAAASSS